MKASHWQRSRHVMVCCHDAGGAEILSEWVRDNPGKSYQFLLEGPATAVFRRKLSEFPLLSREEARSRLPTMDFLLTGTSWASTLEREWIGHARQAGVFSATYLDHWVNYSARFDAPGGPVLPDEIWTGDAEAFALAEATFPGRPVRLQSNPYFERIRRELEQMPAQDLPADEVRLLYVCEPIAIDCPALTSMRQDIGYTEFDALAFCLERLECIVPSGRGHRIRLRPHPSEKAGKYEPVLARYRERMEIEVSAGRSLMADCQWSTDVVGCGSMAMMVALLGGRRVYSSIPLAGVACALPCKDIRYLRDLARPSARQSLPC